MNNAGKYLLIFFNNQRLLFISLSFLYLPFLLFLLLSLSLSLFFSLTFCVSLVFFLLTSSLNQIRLLEYFSNLNIFIRRTKPRGPALGSMSIVDRIRNDLRSAFKSPAPPERHCNNGQVGLGNNGHVGQVHHGNNG